ncbi:hypothetical protein D3C87_1900030 [compost metagenome]
MYALTALDAAIRIRAQISTRRRPKRSMAAAANGPTSPYRNMPTAAANEIELRLQPKASSSGTSNTLGEDRSPAATSSDRKITATTTNAYFCPARRNGKGGWAILMLLTGTY